MTRKSKTILVKLGKVKTKRIKTNKTEKAKSIPSKPGRVVQKVMMANPEAGKTTDDIKIKYKDIIEKANKNPHLKDQDLKVYLGGVPDKRQKISRLQDLVQKN